MNSNDEALEDEDRIDPDAPPAKRRRNFIARNACQACRTKKSRCDEGSPCGLCKSLDIECVYTERRGFKHETSLSVIMAAIRRMESKIDHFSSNIFPVPTLYPPPHAPGQVPPVNEQVSSAGREDQTGLQTTASPDVPRPESSTRQELSYSARRTLRWALDPTSLSSQDRGIHLESHQRPLPTDTPGSLDWLSSLDVPLVEHLSNAYFDTFNRAYPILDPDFYFADILGSVVDSGFPYNVESTLVLCVIALGCMGRQAYEEGDYAHRDHTNHSLDYGFGPDGLPGLYFLNEARKRIGFILCERDLRACQCYLLLAAYYAQLFRPLDEWAMTNQACQISAAYWTSTQHEDGTAYLVDMHRRIFWSALLRETILVDELELPRCTLHDLEINDTVPLPTFHEYHSSSPHKSSSHPRRPQDAYYHYHFLAQIAIRLLMTRTRSEIFNTNPSYALMTELRHQFNEWRRNIPSSIRPDLDTTSNPHSEPAQTYVIAMLQGRYHIARYHFGRPFLFKAITSPGALRERDVEICREAVMAAVEWWEALRQCVRVRSFNQVLWFICGQLFGQLLIVHRLRTAEDGVAREIVPDGNGIEAWFAEGVAFLQDMAQYNPTIARDASLLVSLTRAGPEQEGQAP